MTGFQSPIFYYKMCIELTSLGAMYCFIRPASPVPSAMSFFKCRIETFQPYARVLAGELPVNLAAHLLNGVNPAIETLARHHTDFRFGHIQPATVFRCVHKFNRSQSALDCVGSNASYIAPGR